MCARLCPVLIRTVVVCLFAFTLASVSAAQAQDGGQPGTVADIARPVSEPTPAEFAAQTLECINAYRSERGLPVLKADPLLDELAMQHSRYMREKDELSHDDFISRFVASGGQRCVENVGWNYKSAQAQVEGWRKSPLHDKNLLDAKITLAGVAQDGKYVTFLACVPLAR